MNVTFVSDLDNLIESQMLKTLYGLATIFGFAISTVFVTSFVYHEHYGGDPMKRSIKVSNNISNGICKHWCFFNQNLLEQDPCSNCIITISLYIHK